MAFSPPFKQSVIAWTGVIVFVLLIIGIYCVNDVWQVHKREKRAYAMLLDCMDPLVFEDFIAKYPNSKHIDDVRKRYWVSLAEQPKLETIVRNASRNELLSFISSHPESIFLVQLATERIDTMDWHSAQEGASMRSMERYMQEHPEGAFYFAADMQYKKYERIQLDAELQTRLEAEARVNEEADTLSLEFVGIQLR